MKRILSLLMALCLMLLCGCGTAETNATTVPSTEASEPSATETDPEPTQTDPEPTETDPEPTETEPVVLYTNPLTGEPLEALTTNRPYCIMFNNSQAAMPQHGVSQADILYETLVEGGMTRCMGVFYDLSSATEVFGSIRSARRDFVSLSQAYDAIYVHAGRSDNAEYGAKQYLAATGWDHIDGVHGAYAESYFYRNQDRISSGYSYEHTLFITPENVIAYATRMKCTLTRSESQDYGYSFDDEAVTVGSSAKSISVWFNYSSTPYSWNKSTSFRYDEDSKLYLASQYGSDYVDGNTGEALAFRNILVLNTGIRQNSTSEHMCIDTVGSGTGHFACNGMIVPIKWSRASVNDPFTYTLENGTPITFGVGKTYIAIVPKNAALQYE